VPAFEGSKIRNALERLTPRQRQYAALAAIIACGVGALWAVFAFSDDGTKVANSQKAAGSASDVTNIGVMSPGQQVNPMDQWVGTAGRKLAQYEREREEQARINKDRKDFEERTMKRFGDLEQRLTTPAVPPAVPPLTAPVAPTPAASLPVPYPAARALPTNLPPPPSIKSTSTATAATTRSIDGIEPPATGLVHVTMADGKTAPAPPSPESSRAAQREANARSDSIDTYLPVSFTRGILLGGLDAPTGGQAQSNPHPVLIRLSDNSVLPNRFRAEYRECFVIAAGYGDISSERAYLRTETLSCVRDDGSTLEVKIQGSVYGEDGKVGMRGRLVTKQGQILANALLAGLASGLGQGLATASGTFSTSAFGTIATTSGSDALRTGLGTGTGRALDRLAQYYIKLAEQTFPVIEVDAGRTIDVVVTRGVRIDAPAAAKARPTSNLAAAHRSPEERYLKGSRDEDY
jgi:conjugal transfer pilus assembly protein TraB